jgi:hypothetical protein
MDAVATFYELNQVTRKRHGLPPQPFGFFCAIHEYVLLKALGFAVLASYRGKPVAAAVFHFGKKVLYKYGASVPEHQQLRANNLVMWKAIERLSKRGFESLYLAGPLDRDGLRQSVRWGAKEYPISYYKHDFRQNKFVTHEQPVHGVTKMIFGSRRPVLKAIGSLAYRHGVKQ